MSKLPPLTIGQEGIARPADLQPHHLCADLPIHGHIVEKIKASFARIGIQIRILITPDREIVDGRHRWKGCIAAKMATRECLPYTVVDPANVADLIVMSVAERYDLSVGAKVYMLLPMVEKAVAEGVGERAANLKKGESPENRLDRVSGKMGLKKLAEELGCSDDMLSLARKTAQLFAESDKRIDGWLTRDLEMQASWEEYQGTAGLEARWTNWRAVRLKDMGHDPDEAASAAIIPESYREIYEAKLFSVEPGENMGLGAINKAVGSALATKGQARPDVDAGNTALHLTLGNKLKSFTKTMFGRWDDLESSHRLTLAGSVADAASTWPTEVKVAVAAALKGGKP